MAAYQRRRQDEKQKTLDVRNRKLIAARVYGVDQEYFRAQRAGGEGLDAESLESSGLPEDGEPNPFVN